MKSDRRLDQPLIEQPKGPAGRPPHIFPDLVGFEVPSCVEKIYSCLHWIGYGRMHSKSFKSRDRRKKNRKRETQHDTCRLVPTQAVFAGHVKTTTLRLQRSVPWVFFSEGLSD